MPRPKPTYQHIIRAILSFFVVLFVSIELLFRMYGLPPLCRHLLEDSLSHAGMSCRFSWIKASFFKGLTFQGVTVKMDSSLGPLLLTAQEASASFNPLRLCQRNFLPDELRLNAANLQLFSDNGIALLDCQKIFFFAKTIEKDKLSGNLTLSQNGIRIRGEIILDNYQQLPSQIRHLLSQKDSRPMQQNSKIGTLLEAFQRRFESCEFGENDTLLTFSCQGDVNDWNSLHGSGDFDLNYGQIGPLLIQKQRGRFQYSHQLLELIDLHWLLSSNEQIQADLSIDFKTQSISADFQGRLMPETCLHLAMVDPPPWPNFISCPLPIAFQGKLPTTKWDFSEAAPQMSCSLKSFSVMGTQFQQGGFSLHSKNGVLFLDDLALNLDFRQTKGVRGNLRWHLAEKRLSADLESRFNLQEILQNHGFDTKQAASMLTEFDDVRLKVSLDDSPLDWRQWRINGQLLETGSDKIDLYFQNLTLPFRIEDGWLDIDNASFEINREGSTKVAVSAKSNLDEMFKKNLLAAEFSLHISNMQNGQASASEMLTASAKCQLDLKNRRFQLNDGESSLIPDLFIDGFKEQLARIYAPLPRFLSGAQAVKVSFHIPDFELAKKNAWRILLQIEAENTRFRQLEIHKVKADGEISARQADFRNIRAVVNENEDFALDLSILFRPAALSVKNALVHARPELFDAFIFNDGASNIYRKIWENVVWDMECLPEIRVADLLYWEAPSNTHNWQLRIDASLELQNASFKDFPIPGGSIGVKLELPEALTIEPITLKTRQGDINAKVAFSFTGVPNCSFSLAETQVPLDVMLLLKSINDDWKEFLDLITLHPDAKLACKGDFDIANNPSLQISGNILSPEITFRKAQLENVLCQWNYQANRLFWNIPEAFFLGARLNSTGFYDFQTSSAESLLKIRNLSLDKAENFFLGNPDSTRKNPLGGLINSDCRVSLLKKWAESPLYLEGGGHFSLREADLWQVPLMDNLASILSLGSMQLFSRDKVSGLGNISRLDADFSLQGNRLLVSHFDTNGTILSLHGSGEYAWGKDQLHFTVKGEALKNVNLLSFMLKPLSWAFDAELTGPLKKPEWKIRSALNKMFETQ